jgi:hypothetical protein
MVLSVIAGIISWRAVRDLNAREAEMLRELAADSGSGIPPPIFTVENTTDTDALAERPVREILISAGNFTDGGRRFTPALPPAAFDRIEVSLLFTADSLPADTNIIVGPVLRTAAAWEAAGAEVTEIVIDSRPDIFDINSISKIARALRADSMRGYTVGAFLRREWLENRDDMRRKAWNLSKHVRTFYFDQNDIARDGEDLSAAIRQLDSDLRFAFVIRTDGREKPEDMMKKYAGSASFFVGFAADPAPQP